MVAWQNGLITVLCHGHPRYKGLSGIPACQAFPKSVFFRCSGRSLPRHPCPQWSLRHGRVSDRSIIGLLPRAPPSQVSVRHPRVSGRPQNSSLPRLPPLQVLLWQGRVSDLPEIGLFPLLRRFSATAPCSQGSLEPPRVSGWCRIGPFPVISPYPDTATPATGIPVAVSRVRPS